MPDPKTIFKHFCKQNDMRYTPERELIIDEIYLKDGHFDVDQLFLRLRNKYPKIKLARGSIYRTIPILISAGLIRESFHKDGHAFFEHILGRTHHDHMKCLNCGKIFEFYSRDIDKIQESICKKRKFMIVDHVHILIGYCEKCSIKGLNKRCRAPKPKQSG